MGDFEGAEAEYMTALALDQDMVKKTNIKQNKHE